MHFAQYIVSICLFHSWSILTLQHAKDTPLNEFIPVFRLNQSIINGKSYDALMALLCPDRIYLLLYIEKKIKKKLRYVQYTTHPQISICI